jgi:hypothetical protein
VDTLGQHQQNEQDLRGHRPVGKTIKSHADIISIIRGSV